MDLDVRCDRDYKLASVSLISMFSNCSTLNPLSYNNKKVPPTPFKIY